MAKFHQGFFKPKNPHKYKGNPTNIVYRSGWESKLMKYFDEHDDIIWWQSEEIVVPYFDITTNRPRRYFPDFLIHTKTKQTIMIEVKPSSQVKPPKKKDRITKGYINEVLTYGKNHSKWEAAELFCKKRGWTFSIMTEDQIFGTKR